ncbi:MAG: SAM-dependent methyltransferase, partial [Gammaproteobacteria bacterium]|nr:SAM-dependent methyltransferase [Gammaproteobacteria bacterium]
MAGATLGARVAITIILVAPLATAMGMPFPIGLRAVDRTASGLIPWAWAVNGCASVVSAVLAVVLAMHFGFSAVILCAVILYGLAALAGWRGIHHGATAPP